jgi:hypothetical protein
VIEDDDQTILKAIDKALGSPLFSSMSPSYVLPAKGVGNFRAIADLGKVLSHLSGTKFDIVFVQDRDGMPDFMVEPFRESQEGDGVAVRLLARHEIESYLISPEILVAGAGKAGVALSIADAQTAIVKAGGTMKAEARRMSRETALGVNRHLPAAKRKKDFDLEVEVDRWFDNLDLSSMDVVRVVFPGKELLIATIKEVERTHGKMLTRGALVAALTPDLVADDIRLLMKDLSKT